MRDGSCSMSRQPPRRLDPSAVYIVRRLCCASAVRPDITKVPEFRRLWRSGYMIECHVRTTFGATTMAVGVGSALLLRALGALGRGRAVPRPGLPQGCETRSRRRDRGGRRSLQLLCGSTGSVSAAPALPRLLRFVGRSGGRRGRTGGSDDGAAVVGCAGRPRPRFAGLEAGPVHRVLEGGAVAVAASARHQCPSARGRPRGRQTYLGRRRMGSLRVQFGIDRLSHCHW